jgi:hypothetical protein
LEVMRMRGHPGRYYQYSRPCELCSWFVRFEGPCRWIL